MRKKEKNPLKLIQAYNSLCGMDKHDVIFGSRERIIYFFNHLSKISISGSY